MKLILALGVVLLLFTTTADSQLTDADLNKIRLVVKEEVEKAIDASEKRMKEYIAQEIGTVNIKISEMDKRLTGKIESLDKDLSGDIETLGERLNNIFLLTLGLLAFIAVAVGVPQIIVAMQRKDIRTQDERIESQQKQIETLLQEIETLKQERIASP
ncbi:hypothetical protein C6501_09210 [Candidatus Poribacteria bacterium]|nr:MAG: hypothetical protein C6501_09210 [Candidatus Poribacteria bacterium]